MKTECLISYLISMLSRSAFNRYLHPAVVYVVVAANMFRHAHLQCVDPSFSVLLINYARFLFQSVCCHLRSFHFALPFSRFSPSKQTDVHIMMHIVLTGGRRIERFPSCTLQQLFLNNNKFTILYKAALEKKKKLINPGHF